MEHPKYSPGPQPKWFQRRLLRIIALVPLLVCLWLAATVTRSLANATLDVLGENLRFTLRIVAERLPGDRLDEATIEAVFDDLWILPGPRRWVLAHHGVAVLAHGEGVSSREDLLETGQQILATTPGARAVKVLGGPGRRRLVAGVRLDSQRVLVVEYHAKEFWRHHGEVFSQIFFATLLATLLVALLLSRQLTRPLLERLHRLQRTLERYGDGKVEARLPTDAGQHEFTPVFAAFNRMADRIAELEREREAQAAEERTLLASLAHDINTPMTVIRGYAEMLHERGGELGEEARERIAAEFLGQSLYVQSMLEDLLAITRAESHQLTLNKEIIELDTLFDSLVDTFQPVAARQGTVLVAEGHGFEIEADPLRLRQILTNLLRNAILHGEGATLIELRAHRGEAAMILAVEDDGVGVPESQVPQLFERPPRNSEEGARGWGLGLTIVRMLTELHAGTCRYVPQEKGACFEVELPLPHREVS